ncbi:D-alanine--D-alanine ligase family protein [Haloimpatiens lingqiaonensis]|uniref:D-alanine--D-alanine ligase family protein n=1 Tax=Haloimpatiens lingqiaonensis TaxID=1380675 RepID=UPI0010FCF461|nr:D-alanine--D-alanine ligase family protein [Haloimpatiens lingqiaonensis]
MKTRVAVLFGGKSTEHEVSRVSATSVLKNIDRDKFDVCVIGITKEGQWFKYNGDINNIPEGKWEMDEENKEAEGYKVLFNKEVDVVFPVLHGLYGEDGTIQGMCKLIGIPCVGPGVMSSAVCMDKVYTKYVLENFGIRQADYVVVNKIDFEENKENIIEKIKNKLNFPVFIKPSNSGSSVGITKAYNEKETEKGLEEALKYDRKILVEKTINAREVEVAVLGNERPIAATPGEVVPDRDFYDYDSKYKNSSSKLLIPANFSVKKLEEIKSIAVDIYKMLDCAGMSRVDFLVDKDTDEIYLNEVNTIPGFTSISMYPKMWENEGKKYNSLITELIELAMERNNN